MPETKHFIQVILPLHLEWEPWYYADRPLEIGEIVEVNIGRRTSLAVVSSAGKVPDVDESRILPVSSVPDGYPRILENQIALWRFIAEYYLCTVGDVFKSAYPAGRFEVEERKSVKRISVRHAGSIQPELYDEKPQKPLLVKGCNRTRFYEPYIQRALSSGKDVLLLHPCAKGESFATLRELSRAVQTDQPSLLEGSKSLLFLPFTKLGLVIVDDEHSAKYKHNQSPRYNGRDVAVALASINGAQTILGSLTPSLETVFNVRTGKYLMKELPISSAASVTLIDTDREKRKNGMVGERSRILLSAIDSEKDAKVLEIEARDLRSVLDTKKIERYGIVAVFNFDYLLSRNDFRSDEKALQMLEELRCRCNGKLFIQTNNSAHRVLSCEYSRLADLLLAERKEFNLPPFTRMVEIRKPSYRDASKQISGPVSFGRQEIVARHFLERDKTLQERKFQIRKETLPGLVIDVDPL